MQCAHQRPGIDVVLLREEEAAAHPVGQLGLLDADLVTDQHLRVAAVASGQIEVGHVVIEIGPVGESHQQAVVPELEVEAVALIVVVRLDRGFGEP